MDKKGRNKLELMIILGVSLILGLGVAWSIECVDDDNDGWCAPKDCSPPTGMTCTGYETIECDKTTDNKHETKEDLYQLDDRTAVSGCYYTIGVKTKVCVKDPNNHDTTICGVNGQANIHAWNDPWVEDPIWQREILGCENGVTCTLGSSVPGYDDSECEPSTLTEGCGTFDVQLGYELHYLNDKSYLYQGETGDLRIKIDTSGKMTGIGGDVVFVLDSSGSMAGQKIADAKDALKGIVDEFIDCGAACGNWSYGLVRFNNDPYVVSGMSNDASSIKDKIDDIIAGGCTSIGDGLCTAQNYFYPEGGCITSNHDFIILASDGVQNTPAWLEDIVPGIPPTTTVYTIGVGDEFTPTWEKNLEQVALLSGTGEGRYYYAPDASDLNEIYQIIAGILNNGLTVSHNLTITVKLGPNAVYLGESYSDDLVIQDKIINGNNITYIVKLRSSNIDPYIDVKYKINSAETGAVVASEIDLDFDTNGVCDITDQLTNIQTNVQSGSLTTSMGLGDDKEGAITSYYENNLFYVNFTYTDPTHTDEFLSGYNCYMIYSDNAGKYLMTANPTLKRYEHTRNRFTTDFIYYATCYKDSFVFETETATQEVSLFEGEPGQECDDNSDCNEGLFCDLSMDHPICKNPDFEPIEGAIPEFSTVGTAIALVIIVLGILLIKRR